MLEIDTDSRMEINVDVIGIIYSLLVIAGGIFGYVKAASLPSIIAGVSCGLICGFGALISNYYVMAVVGLVLAGVMSFRFFKYGAIMPAGVIALLRYE